MATFADEEKNESGDIYESPEKTAVSIKLE